MPMEHAFAAMRSTDQVPADSSNSLRRKRALAATARRRAIRAKTRHHHQVSGVRCRNHRFVPVVRAGAKKGVIEGRVTDSSGAALPGAEVKLSPVVTLGMTDDLGVSCLDSTRCRCLKAGHEAGGCRERSGGGTGCLVARGVRYRRHRCSRADMSCPLPSFLILLEHQAY
jgi:hypothetical protein